MTYDIIVIGGGLAGSAFGAKMSEAGRKVLVLERETEFRDRVRGEMMLPWGVAAAQRLGILKILEQAGGHHARWWITYMGGQPIDRRDLAETTPHKPLGLFNLYHPTIQEAMLHHALRTGVEIRRGATVTNVINKPGENPSVTFEKNGENQTESARLVVGADGRNSQVRRWCEFEEHRHPDHLMIAGTLLENCPVPEDGAHLLLMPEYCILLVPQGNGRVRAYCGYPLLVGRRQLTGEKKKSEFLRLCRETGAPEEWFKEVTCVGPLAEFSGAEHWVASPIRNRVALIGDAAACSDPSWGSGLALTVTDVEHLAQELTASEDWDKALANYAVQHNDYSLKLREIHGWMTELSWGAGPEAEARRQKVFPKMFQDPTGFPDHIGAGPFGPSDEKARRLILGLD